MKNSGAPKTTITAHTETERRFVIGVSGASGALYAAHFIRSLAYLTAGSSQLIVSPAALRVYRQEMQGQATTAAKYLAEILATPPVNAPQRSQVQHQFHVADYHDIGARAASGSSPSDGMVVIPCSMKSIAAIAHGYSSNLLERAADVCLKERRRLVLVPRETPYSVVHLQNMLQLSQAGAIILPASPGFYQRPLNIDALAQFIAGRILALFQIDHQLFPAWDGETSI